MASNSSSRASSIDPIYRWLRHVDEQISPGESVEILKLALHPFLRIQYRVAHELTSPSEIYNFLLEKCFQNDKNKALQWFAFALSLLGGGLRGTYLIGNDCLQLYGISLPTIPSSNRMNPELQFFHCLTKIAKKAGGFNLGEELKHQFSKRSYLNVNPRHIKHLPDLFVRLVQNEIISPTKTYHLLKALLKVGSHNAKQCLLYLNDYHKSVGLGEIKDIKGIERDPQTSVFENSSTDDFLSDSVMRAPSISPRLLGTSKSFYKYASEEHEVERVPRDMDESMKTLDRSRGESETASTIDSRSEIEVSSEESSDLLPKEPIPEPPPSNTLRKRTVLCLCWILAILVALAMIGGLFGTVWRNMLITQEFDDVFVYDKTTVVVAEIDLFYHRQFKLFPKLGYPLRDSVIEIYRFNSSCDQLPTKYNISHWRKSNVSGSQNYTHLYLLPGSVLNYTISSVDHNFVSLRVADSVTQLDTAVENTKGYVYITRGPEFEEFDSTNCNKKPDCTIEFYEQFTYGHNNLYYAVENRGYYNFHTAHVVSKYIYTLDLAINATTMDLEQAQHVCNISDVNKEERSCIVDLEFKIGHVCFIAYTDYEESPYVILNIAVTKQLEWVLVTTMVPLAFVLLMVFGCLTLYTIIKVCCCKRKSQYRVVNLDA